MVVCEAGDDGVGSGRMANLHVGIVLSHLLEVGLIAEAVAEHDVAAGVNHLAGGVVAVGSVFGDVPLEDELIIGQAEGFLSGQDRLIEVVVVGGHVGIVQEDHADLDLGEVEVAVKLNQLGGNRLKLIRAGARRSGVGRGRGLRTAGSQTDEHQNDEQSGYDLFHVAFFSLNFFM